MTASPFSNVPPGTGSTCAKKGGLEREGLVYSGGLGFSHTNWDEFNTFGYPADAAYATPDQQIRVAVAFATRYWGNPNAAPDQNGCSGRLLTGPLGTDDTSGGLQGPGVIRSARPPSGGARD